MCSQIADMKSISLAARISLSLKSWLFCCGLIILSMQSLPAQNEATAAQAGIEPTSQSQQEQPTATVRPRHSPKLQLPSTILQITPQRSADAAVQLLGKDLRSKLHPAQPHRPIPILLIVLGLLMVFLWSLVLIATILAGSAGLALLLLIATIVLSPLLIVGIIFVIGGCIAGIGHSKKPKA